MLAYAGKASFHQEALDINEVVHELTQLVRASIPKKIEKMMVGTKKRDAFAGEISSVSIHKECHS